MHCWARFLKKFSFKKTLKILKFTALSKSQLNQEVFVLSIFQFKRNGYFIEFGATDGKKLSNTLLLEKKFAWTGILSEPAQYWHKNLIQNRNVVINTQCIWSSSGPELEFSETRDKKLSTLRSLSDSDRHALKRLNAKEYKVETITLLDLLRKHRSPKSIDFLSVDTEGSEFEILRDFDFSEYSFGIVVCEHNFGMNQLLLDNLFKQNGYLKILNEMTLWDAWYVNQKLIAKLQLEEMMALKKVLS
jgi:FkbM family methyltransferase